MASCSRVASTARTGVGGFELPASPTLRRGDGSSGYLFWLRVWQSYESNSFSSASCGVINRGAQFINQGAGMLKITRIEPLGEPAIDRRNEIASSMSPSLITPKASESESSAQLERPGALLARYPYSLLKAGLSLVLTRCSEQLFAAYA